MPRFGYGKLRTRRAEAAGFETQVIRRSAAALATICRAASPRAKDPGPRVSSRVPTLEPTICGRRWTGFSGEPRNWPSAATASARPATASAVAAPRLGYYLRCLAPRQRQCASEASPRPCQRRGAGAVRCLRDERKNASTTIENGLQPNYACSGRCMASQHCRFAILEELVLSGGSPICTNASVAASKP